MTKEKETTNEHKNEDMKNGESGTTNRTRKTDFLKITPNQYIDKLAGPNKYLPHSYPTRRLRQR